MAGGELHLIITSPDKEKSILGESFDPLLNTKLRVPSLFLLWIADSDCRMYSYPSGNWAKLQMLSGKKKNRRGLHEHEVWLQCKYVG